MRRFFSGALLLMSAFSSHSVLSQGSGYGDVSIGGFSQEEQLHSGADISVLLTSDNHFGIRLSGTLFSDANKVEARDLYTGFGLTAYAHLNQRVLNPYLGLGATLGETFNCSDEQEERGCEEDNSFPIYPELGLGLRLGPIHIFPYVRRNFYIGTGKKSVDVFGLRVGYNLDPTSSRPFSFPRH